MNPDHTQASAATILALADNPRLGVAAYPITLVVKGSGGMPGGH